MKSFARFPRPLLTLLLALPVANLSAQINLPFNPGENWGDNIDTGSGNDVTASVASGTASISGTIFGDGSLTMIGPGTLTLGGTNTYSGGTFITGGTLSVASAGNLGTGNLTASGGGDLSATQLEINGARTFTITGTGSTLTTGYLWLNRDNSADLQTLNITNGGAVTVTSTVSFADLNAGSTGNLNVTGTGSTLAASGNIYVGYAGNSTVTIADGGTLSTGAVLSIATTSGSNGTVNLNAGGTLAVGGDGGIAIGAGTGLFNFNGGTLDVTGSSLTSSAAMTLGAATTSTINTNALDATLSGVLSGTGALAKTGTGTLTLEGANTYSGDTTVSAGILELGTATTLQHSTVNLNGGTLGFGSLTSATLGGLAGSTNLALTNETPAAVALTVGGNNASTTYSGVLSGEGSLTKTGDGTLTLSAANTFTGGLTVADGTVAVASAAPLGAGDIDITGGTLAGSAHLSLDRDVTVSNNGSLTTVGYLEIGSAGNGSLTVSDGGQVTSGTSTAFGVLAGTTGTATLSDFGSRLDVNGTLYVGHQGQGTLNIDDGAVVSAEAISMGLGATGDGTINVNFSGTLELTGTDTIDVGLGSGTITLTGGRLRATGDLSTDFGFTLGADDQSYIDPDGHHITLSGALTGAGGINVDNPGTVTLSGANTFTGVTYYGAGGAGTLEIAHADALRYSTLYHEGNDLDISSLGSLNLGGLAGNGDLVLENGSNAPIALTVGFNNTDSDFNGSIGGTGSLTKTGTALFGLSGSSTFTGSTTINGGTLQISADANLGTAPATPTPDHLVIDGGTLANAISDFEINSNRGITLGEGGGTFQGNITYNGIIAGAGDLTKTGADTTLTLGGANTFTGQTNVVSGNLRLDHEQALQNSTLVWNGTGELLADENVDTLYLGGLAGSQDLTAHADLDIGANGVSTTFSGAIQGASRTITKSGTGTLTLSGANTYTGATNVQSGTLAVSGESAAISSTSALNIGATDTATVNVTDGGTIFASSITLGETATGDGTLDITAPGPMSELGVPLNVVSHSDVIIGDEGSGTVALSGGGALLSLASIRLATGENGSATVTVTGTDGTSEGRSGIGAAGSLVIAEGTGSTASVTVAAGAHAAFDGGIVIAAGDDSTGTLTITGSDATAGTHSQLRTVNLSPFPDPNIVLTIELASGTGSTATLTLSNGGEAILSDSDSADALTAGPGTATVTLDGGILSTTAGGTLTSSVALALSGNNTLNTEDGAISLSGVLSGAGGFTKTGSGTLTLSAANTFSGETSMTGGTLEIQHAQALQNSTLVFDHNAVLDVHGSISTLHLGGLSGSANFEMGFDLSVGANGDDTTFSGVLSGEERSLTKVGVGTLTLTGSNTYTGNTTITGGKLSISADTNLGDASNSPTLTLNGGTLLTTADLTLGSDRNLDIGSSHGTFETAAGTTLTLDSGFSTSNNVAKTGAGSLNLTANAGGLGGILDVSAGTVRIVDGATLESAEVQLSGGSLVFGGSLGSATFDGLGGSGNLLLENENDGAVALTVGNIGNRDTHYSGVLSGTGSLEVAAGTLQLSNENTFSGAVSIGGGKLVLGHTHALATQAITIDGELGFADITSANLTQLAGSGSMSLQNDTNAAVALTVGSNNASTAFTGNISGNGSLTKIGSGDLVLAGTNDFTGDTTIAGGTITLTDSNALSGSTVTTTGSLRFSGITGASLGNISGPQNLLLENTGGSALALEVGNNNSSTTFSGTISGDGSLAKYGSGTLTLTGANTYAGSTTINTGTLSIAADSALGTTPGSATPGHLTLYGGTLATTADLTLHANRGLTFAAPAALDVAADTTLSYAGNLAGSGDFTKSGGGILTLSGTTSHTGTTTIAAGTLEYATRNAFYNGATRANPSVHGGATAAFHIGDTGYFTAADIADILGDDNFRNGATLALNTANAAGGTFTLATVIADGDEGDNTLNLSKLGTGTLVLAGDNTYTGATTIAAGTVTLASSTALGSTAAGTTVDTGATLALSNNITVAEDIANAGTVINAADTNTLSGTLSGTGDLSVTAGQLTLSGDNTYTGATTVSAGTLILASSTALGSTGVGTTVDSGATLALTNDIAVAEAIANAGSITSTSGTNTLSGSLSGTGSLTVAGGQLTLAGANTFSGATTVSDGNLVVAHENALQHSTLTTGSGHISFGFLENANIRSLAGSGTITVDSSAPSFSLTVGSGGAYDSTFGGSLEGDGNLIKAGTGSLTLNGSGSSFTGTATLAGGILVLGSSSALEYATLATVDGGGAIDFGIQSIVTLGGLSGDGDLTLPGTFSLSVGNSSPTTTYSGSLSGTGSLTLTGGQLTLAGANTHTGTTTLQSGTLVLGHSLALQSSVLDHDAGGTLSFGALSAATLGGLDGSNSLDLGGITLTLDVASGGFNDPDYSGTLSGSGSLIKTGAGTQILSGANTFSGDTTVSAGTLRLTNADALQNSTLVTTATGTIDLSSLSELNLGGLAGNGNLAAGFFDLSLDVGSNNTETTYSGVLSGNVDLTKSGPGTLVLAGANTFSGEVDVTEGSLALDNTLAVQNAVVTLDNGNLYFKSIEAATLGGLAGSRDFELINESYDAVALTLNVSNIGSDPEFSGAIFGSGSLTKTGSGTQILSGVNTYTGGTTVQAGTLVLSGANTFTGDTTVSGGTLRLTHVDALQDSTLVTSSAGGSIDFDNLSSVNLGGLEGSGNLSANFSDLILNVGANDQSTTYSGILADGGPSKLSLTKSGSGTLTLAGANTFSGTTTVSAGTLELAHSQALQNSVVSPGSGLDFGALTAATFGGLSGSGTLALTNSAETPAAVALTLDVDSGGFENPNYSGVLSGPGSLTKSGSGTQVLSGANTFTGDTTVTAGTLRLDHADALQYSTLTTVAGVDISSLSTLNLGGLSGSGSLSAGFSDLALHVGANDADTTFSGVLADGGLSKLSFTKSGTGNLTLTGDNTYTGDTTVAAGTVTLASSTALGSTAAGTTVNAGATLALSNNITVAEDIANAGTVTSTAGTNTLSGNLSGTGSLSITGAGTLTLTGTNSYTGATAVAAGNLTISADTHLGTAPGTATPGHLTLNGGTLATTATFTLAANRGIALGASGGIFDTADSTTLSYGGIISGSGALTKTGAGTLTLSGENTYTGSTTVAGGTLIATDDRQLGTGAITINNGGALEFTTAPVFLARTVTIDGNDSRLSGPDNDSPDSDPTDEGVYVHFIAYDGSGDVSVTNGGALTGTFLALGSYSNQPMNVTIASGSTLSASRVLALGYLAGAELSASVTGTGSSLIVGNPAEPNTMLNGLILGAGNTESVTLTVAGGGSVTADSIVTGFQGFGSGSLTINDGGTVITSVIGLGSDNGYGEELILNPGGTLRIVGTAGENGTISALSGSNFVSLRGGTLQIAQRDFESSAGFALADSTTSTLDLDTVNATLTGSLSGDGALTKTGTGTLTLTGTNSYAGGTSISGGVLAISTNENLGDASGTVSFTGGTLHSAGSFTAARATTLGTGGGTFDTTEGTTLTWNGDITGAANNDLTKIGAGTLELGGNNSYFGATHVNQGILRLGSSTALSPNTALHIASGAAFDANGFQQTVTGLAGSGSVNTGSAGMTIQTSSDASPTVFEGTLAGDGGVTVSGTGMLTIASSGHTYTGETTVSGGTLKITGDISSSSLTAVSGTGILAGTGTVGVLSLANGGTLAPGASPGTFNAGNTTWDVGGHYAWEINDADDSATPGTTWDLLNITGTLTFSATEENLFTISLLTLTAGNDSGPLFNFSSAQNYAYTIASASGGIFGFNANAITLNLSGFANDLAGGAWSVAQSGNNVNLVFTSAIPEPSTYAALFGALALALAAIRRRRA